MPGVLVVFGLFVSRKKKKNKSLGWRHEGDVNNFSLHLLGDSLGVSEGKEVT